MSAFAGRAASRANVIKSSICNDLSHAPMAIRGVKRSRLPLHYAYASATTHRNALHLSIYSLRTPACAYLSPSVNGNARCISTSCPRLEAASKQSPPKPDAAASTAPNHQPPLPVRIALVSTTTALATPSFPALGFLYLVLRITVPDANLRKAMEGRWGTLLSFTTWTLLPKLYHGTVASLILPCAVGNAVVAGGVYGLVDLACGGPSSSTQSLNKVLQTPWITGSGIGATVGYVAPNYVYGPVMENLYALDGMSQSMQHVMSFPYATEVSVATGAVAGMLLHPLLYFPMNGVAGVHWGAFSGAALAAVSSALVYVYYGREEVGLPVPEGSFITPSEMALVDSIIRYNNASKNVETYSLKEGAFVGPTDQCLEGRKIADTSRSYSESGKKVVFDDRLLAFVYNYWDAKTKERYPGHIVSIKATQDLERMQDSMAVTDASVALALHKPAASDIADILTAIDELSSKSKGQKQISRTAACLEDVSAAIEVLMTMKQSGQSHPNADVSTLERFVKGRCPELTLWASEEEYEGTSVESQLRRANWEGPELSEAVHRWMHVHEKERKRKWRNRALVVATGLLLSIAGSILQNR